MRRLYVKENRVIGWRGRWASGLAICGIVALAAVSLPGAARAGADAAVADELIVEHAEELGLSDTQVEEIRDLHKQHRRESIRRRADIDIAELELEDLMDDAGADLATVEQKMRQLSELRIQERLANLRLRRQIHDVLTPEQRDELGELRRKRHVFHLKRPGFHLKRLVRPQFERGRGPMEAARMAARCAEIAARVEEARERAEPEERR